MDSLGETKIVKVQVNVSFYFQYLSVLLSPRKEQQRLPESLNMSVLQQKIQQKNSEGRSRQVWRLKTSSVCQTPSTCSEGRTSGGKGQAEGGGEKTQPNTHNYINWLSYEIEVELENEATNAKLKIKPN